MSMTSLNTGRLDLLLLAHRTHRYPSCPSHWLVSRALRPASPRETTWCMWDPPPVTFTWRGAPGVWGTCLLVTSILSLPAPNRGPKQRHSPNIRGMNEYTVEVREEGGRRRWGKSTGRRRGAICGPTGPSPVLPAPSFSSWGTKLGSPLLARQAYQHSQESSKS